MRGDLLLARDAKAPSCFFLLRNNLSDMDNAVLRPGVVSSTLVIWLV